MYNKKICILELMEYSIFRISYMQGTLLGVGCKIVNETDTSEIYILIREPDTGICKQTNLIIASYNEWIASYNNTLYLLTHIPL